MNQQGAPGQQRRIGLTGGIATGKSSVGRLLAERDLPVLDADALAHQALAPGSMATAAVLDRYGKQVRRPSSGAAIDRAALGRIVFTDSKERQWLEQLVHPIVRAGLEAALAELGSEAVVVLMIPLLFEAGLEHLCSEIWLVDCDETQQLQRLMARDALNEEDARARIAAQWPLARKRALANVVIDNRGQPNALAAQVEQALRRP